MAARELKTGKERTVFAKFVFVGAGGGSLAVLQLAGLPEAKGFGGFLFFFNYTATTEIYTLSLHDALPIYQNIHRGSRPFGLKLDRHRSSDTYQQARDRKSTRLNSSHLGISYAVFCLK